MSQAKGRRISEVALSFNGASKTQQSNAFTAAHRVNLGVAVAEWQFIMERVPTDTSPVQSLE